MELNFLGKFVSSTMTLVRKFREIIIKNQTAPCVYRSAIFILTSFLHFLIIHVGDVD